ncbi:unnamed protein product [Acanthoscelides obtectus]|uniref:Uncharacterized protein n=1 Tax=Acanthoscelides obtectus TaxID=200917 RepID=A0A9P0PZU9_ACAOB|nr:unnamed protein product [Acanthoscelides obtectus]CAK1657830.1 hypothetical protein AOBTE_LOCUS20557 [Acanthoscelides obtectus]
MHTFWLRLRDPPGGPPRSTVRDRLPPTDNHNIHSQEKNFSWDGIRIRTAHGD